MAWTALSFQEYGSIRLWWLICVTNGILNPVLLPEPGTIIKVIKPEYVRDIIEQIKFPDHHKYSAMKDLSWNDGRLQQESEGKLKASC